MILKIPRGAPPLLLVLLLIGIVSCGKDDPPQQECPPDLPCATQYGANTFGCYIDGVPWVAKVEPDVLDPSAHPFEVSYDETGYGGFNSNNVKVKARYYGNEFSFFSILLAPLVDTGKVKLDRLSFLSIQFRKPGKSYYIDTAFNHTLMFANLDTINRILSGTFNFTVTRPDDTIKITDGRFDVKYSPE